MSRISRDELFMAWTIKAAERSTCNRKHVGALITFDNHPISVGWAGSAPGEPHCIDAGCLLGPDGGCTRTQHAEMNAIAWAARTGLALFSSTMYCTLTPCPACAKLIARSGVTRFVAFERYRLEEGINILKNAKIHIELYNFKERIIL